VQCHGKRATQRPKQLPGAAHGVTLWHPKPTKENRMSIQVGAQAPDFTLDAHTGNKVSLASFKGRKTVVAFMPFAFTGG
jgi:peroxiredoxin